MRKKGDYFIYLGETIRPRHDVHMHLKSLVTKGSQYKIEGYIDFANSDYIFIHFVDDRNEIGGYEMKKEDITSISEYRNIKINLVTN